MNYRYYIITRTDSPHGLYKFTHVDFAEGDFRTGYGQTVRDCESQIDELEDE